MDIRSVISQLKNEQNRVMKELERLDAALAALNGTERQTRTRRRMSAAGRKRIKLAQAKRWAKWRKARASKN